MVPALMVVPQEHCFGRGVVAGAGAQSQDERVRTEGMRVGGAERSCGLVVRSERAGVERVVGAEGADDEAKECDEDSGARAESSGAIVDDRVEV